MGRGALSFCDHIALAFLESVEPALQKGPICAYRAAVSQGRYLRGRLLLPEQMRMLLTHPGEVVSEHDVFSPDNAFQYLLFWSAAWLARHVRSQVLRRRLERVVSLLPKPEHHYRLPVHAALPAQYSRYRAALEIGNLIAGGASAVLQDQGSSGYGFLFNTERTYEKFLERMLQRIARRHTDWSVTAQRTAALGHPEGAGSVLFTRPDNTLTIQEMVTALIDAKYKCDLAGHGPLRQPRSGDYYQMLASLIAHGCAQALLVVPSEGDLGGEPPLLTWTTASGETIWRVGLLRWDISDLGTKSALLAAQNALEAQLLAFLF